MDKLEKIKERWLNSEFGISHPIIGGELQRDIEYLVSMLENLNKDYNILREESEEMIEKLTIRNIKKDQEVHYYKYIIEKISLNKNVILSYL